MRNQSHMMRWGVSAGLALSLCAASGCIWGPFRYHNDPLEDPQQVSAITSDGFIEFEDGRRFQLAGIQMRPVEETKEATSLQDVVDVIGYQVDINIDAASQTVVCYYKSWNQPLCGTPFLFPHPKTFVHFIPKYRRATLNATLIRVGLARFDPSIGSLSEEDRDHCKDSQILYDRALSRPWQAGSDNSIAWIVQHPRMGGVRLAAGDVASKPLKGQIGRNGQRRTSTESTPGAEKK